MNTKPWHVIVLVLALVAAGWTIFRLVTADSVTLNTVIYCVDVESGDIFRIDTSKYPVIFPARHPGTNRVQLVRVSKDKKSGEWVVSSRDRQSLDALDSGVKNNAVDAESGKLLLPEKSPVDYKPAAK